MTDTMRHFAAAGLLVAVFAGCSGSQIPTPAAEQPVEEEPRVVLRCEVEWRCYAIDPETGKRAGLLRSDTSWSEAYAEFFAEGELCRSAQGAAERVRCREGSPYFEQLEIDRDCSCSRWVEGEE